MFIFAHQTLSNMMDSEKKKQIEEAYMELELMKKAGYPGIDDDKQDYFSDTYEKALDEKEDQDWEEHWKAIEDEEAKEKEREKELRKTKSTIRSYNSPLFDFSGDDLSLDPQMW